MSPEHIALVVRRMIRAPIERVFAAWTQPDLLCRWWGPKSVVCPQAEIDLRVGGEFRIANQFPDGTLVWISGEFELIDAPVKLIYTWRLGSMEAAAERVIVNFERQADSSTQVVVIHERITNLSARNQHEQGWLGCLDGLEALLRLTP